MHLSDLELDALTELFNLGVGQAAAALSQLANEPVQLNVPSVEWLLPEQLLPRLCQTEDTRISSVHQQFRGDLDTDAILMFPAAQSLELVRIMVGDEVALEDLGEMEQEALAEIGNIVLNSVVASLGHSLDLAFDGSLPTTAVGPAANLLPAQLHAEAVLCVNIHFRMAQRDLQGSLIFLLDLRSSDALKSKLSELLAKLS